MGKRSVCVCSSRISARVQIISLKTKVTEAWAVLLDFKCFCINFPFQPPESIIRIRMCAMDIEYTRFKTEERQKRWEERVEIMFPLFVHWEELTSVSLKESESGKSSGMSLSVLSVSTS